MIEEWMVGNAGLFAFLVFVSCAMLLVAAGPCTAGTAADEPCAGLGAPHVVLSTADGQIVIELLAGAAPGAIAEIAALVQSGAYDGLVFDHCQPDVEIVSAAPEAVSVQRVTVEIDAVALGLDEQLVASSDQAMAVLQYELLKAHRKTKKRGGASDQLKIWVDEWHSAYSADFLVGVSQQQINEALGYSYVEGLESRSVTSGAVMLKPASKRAATTRLSIALADMPRRSGRWMVVGQVVAGLDVAASISTRPLTPSKSRQYEPVDPVMIDSAELVCR